MNYLLSNVFMALTALFTRRLTIKSDGIPYRFENLSYKKILNACLTEASVYLKPLRPWGMPIHAMVEPSSLCNLHCTLCPVSIGLGRPTGNMEMATFKKLLEEIGDYIFTLLLWDWGEPFVNPDLYEMISLAKRHSVKTISSTNGHVFENPDNADRLVTSGLDSIVFAIDGIHQDTYERYRQGGRLQSALDGVRAVAERKRARNSQTPLVVFRFIVMEHNEHEIPELKELYKSLGADVLALKTLNAASQDPYFEIESPKREDYHTFLPEDQVYRRFRFGSGGLGSLRRKRNPCRHLWNAPCIHWNGTVVPCTFDPRDRYVLGDLRINSFKEIWNGDGYRRMRKQFRDGWEDIGLCTECTYAYEGGDCSRETIAQVFYNNEKKNHDQQLKTGTLSHNSFV